MCIYLSVCICECFSGTFLCVADPAATICLLRAIYLFSLFTISCTSM
jgi:hypothetical protein